MAFNEGKGLLSEVPNALVLCCVSAAASVPAIVAGAFPRSSRVTVMPVPEALGSMTPFHVPACCRALVADAALCRRV